MAGPSVRLVALDLDGVVFRGDMVLPGVPGAIEELSRRGLLLRFVTNNATLHRSAVAAKLRGMGIPASAEEVFTSGAGAATWLVERLPSGARLLVVGEDGLLQELRDAGFEPRPAEEPAGGAPGPSGEPYRGGEAGDDLDGVAALVVGLDRRFTYGGMARAQAALARGVPFVATNADTTLPDHGALLPGAGALVAAIAAAGGRGPDVVIGKPSLELARALTKATRVAAKETAFVGDRLDTDISMAQAAGMRSVLVLTGVSRREEVDPASPPDLVLESLAELPAALSRL